MMIMDKQCAVCLSDSYTEICDDCLAVFRRNNIIIRNKEDLKYWKEWVDSPAIERKISREVCNSINNR